MRALLPSRAACRLRRSCRRNETAAAIGKSSAISDGDRARTRGSHPAPSDPGPLEKGPRLGNRILGNTLLDNGTDPGAGNPFAFAAADLTMLTLPDTHENCYEDNVPSSSTFFGLIGISEPPGCP
jgi:hypothetical protein